MVTTWRPGPTAVVHVRDYRFISPDPGVERSSFVATDQKTSEVLAEPTTSSVIENELPTYRAISPRAVLSLICGILALFSLAHPFFYIFAALAVVLGLSADRNIQRYPDMLTGRGIARAGAAMGLIFGLGVFTVTTVQAYIVTRNAAGFANHYVDVMKTGGIGDILLLNVPPGQRKGLTANDIMEKVTKSKREESAMLEMKNGPIKNLKKRVDQKDQDLHFLRIEAEGAEGLTHVALALFEVHGPATSEFPAQEENALAVMKGMTGENGLEWWIDEVRYPYKPATAALPQIKPADDGHGHAH